MVHAVEDLPKQLLTDDLKTISRHTDNIALQAFVVDGSTFPGLTCASTKPKLQKDEIPKDVYEEDSFICSIQNNYTGQELKTDVVVRDCSLLLLMGSESEKLISPPEKIGG